MNPISSPTSPRALSANGIMQLMERFRGDPRPDKLNLGVGIYTDEHGRCPILSSIKTAERLHCEQQLSKTSFNLLGSLDFQNAVRSLLFPGAVEGSTAMDMQVIQTLGSSGALHLVGKLLGREFPESKLWMSDPTWENHAALLSGIGGGLAHYRYRAKSRDHWDLEAALEDLEGAAPGDMVLLHACCHNPTGMDPSPAQWTVWADFFSKRRLLPVFDFAYQGFGVSIPLDATPLELFRGHLETMVICSSFSKNMGLYDERVGALTLVCRDHGQLRRWTADVKALVRASYSMPPVHGSAIAARVLESAELHRIWEVEVDAMRRDLDQRVEAFFSLMERAGILGQVLRFQKQRGMFVCLDLKPVEIETLRQERGIYLLDSGRLSIAGLRMDALDRVCEALQELLLRRS